MKLAYYNDNDPKNVAWLKELINQGLIADGDVDHRSIKDVTAGDVRGYRQCHFFAGIGGWSYALRLAGWPDDRPVWTGSCPCQGFSLAGDGGGMSDPRDLWPVFARLIIKHRPAALFGEQVKDAIAHGWLDRLADDLEAEGYSIGAHVLPACSVEAWHERQRLYWFAADPVRFRNARLVPAAHSGFSGSWWPCREANLRHVFKEPFMPGPGWPQPLIRPLDDGLSTRVAGVSGAGNAISPQLAAEFIQACEEAIAANGSRIQQEQE